MLEKIQPLHNKTERTKDDDKNEEIDEPCSEEESSESKPPSKKMKLTVSKKKLSGYKEDPFVFFKDDEDVWGNIKEYYEISEEFDPKCLLTRCHVGKKKNIYFCSPALRDLVTMNQGYLKFINTGLKTFVRSDNRHMKCPFRIAHEGLECMIRHIKGRRVNIPKEDLLKLLDSTDPQKAPEIVSLSQNVQDQVKDVSPGSCVLCYQGTDRTENGDLELKISGWRGTNSLRCYVTDFNASHYLRLLGGDFSKYDVNKFQKLTADEPESELKQEEEKTEAKRYVYLLYFSF